VSITNTTTQSHIESPQKAALFTCASVNLASIIFLPQTGMYLHIQARGPRHIIHTPLTTQRLVDAIKCQLKWGIQEMGGTSRCRPAGRHRMAGGQEFQPQSPAATNTRTKLTKGCVRRQHTR